MSRTKPLSKAEITERALWIAADMLITEGVYFDSGEVTPQRVRRFLRGKARQELLKERGHQKKPIRSPAERVHIGEEEEGSGREAGESERD